MSASVVSARADVVAKKLGKLGKILEVFDKRDEIKSWWDQITEEDIEAHVKHMKDRVLAVLKANGGHTK